MSDVDKESSCGDQMPHSSITDDMEVLRTFAAFPDFTLELISLYYPLPTTWMKKYADILHWGSCAAADYGTYWASGIAFNHAIDWTGEVRAIVAAQLAIRGGDFEFSTSDLDWETYQKRQPTEFIRLVVDYSLLNRTGHLLDFVASCPRTIKTFINADASAQQAYLAEVADPIDWYDDDECEPSDSDEENADEETTAGHLLEAGESHTEQDDDTASDLISETDTDQVPEEWKPAITTPLRWEEAKDLLQKRQVPSLIANPALWDLTLKDLFTETVVKQLLDYFYCAHLEVNCREIVELHNTKIDVKRAEVIKKSDPSRSNPTPPVQPTTTDPARKHTIEIQWEDDIPF